MFSRTGETDQTQPPTDVSGHYSLNSPHSGTCGACVRPAVRPGRRPGTPPAGGACAAGTPARRAARSSFRTPLASPALGGASFRTPPPNPRLLAGPFATPLHPMVATDSAKRAAREKRTLFGASSSPAWAWGIRGGELPFAAPRMNDQDAQEADVVGSSLRRQLRAASLPARARSWMRATRFERSLQCNGKLTKLNLQPIGGDAKKISREWTTACKALSGAAECQTL